MKTPSIIKRLTFIFLICIGFLPQLHAQWFANPVINPFGLDSLGINLTIAFGDLDNDEDNDLMVRSDLCLLSTIIYKSSKSPTSNWQDVFNAIN